mmetsp:Transcript_22904/g.35022  ORF Transcript_22904/g.35022 Transcript_22904/m.35022 type:complete len:133 (-) Transcript_22904:214-612(-)|eukprot:CAMPEP_0118698596 /NCGR_PEP_ID=MMETSP0800-20121206/15304_1 /TAXON_ID=210618 ORGANISM="Striatella unipunctata, Strain CCMP2910" /NCGR_SAMPLE_ID=MMETSP0800 /ASSEMBLY_ACC=CAM_ASM_000638 /LENGTH=132 /DNA_ID=CAMNT_0006598465 /DNA_START=121 /DNA_END=519 /DNA_ORIENTATION=-
MTKSSSSSSCACSQDIRSALSNNSTTTTTTTSRCHNKTKAHYKNNAIYPNHPQHMVVRLGNLDPSRTNNNNNTNNDPSKQQFRIVNPRNVRGGGGISLEKSSDGIKYNCTSGICLVNGVMKQCSKTHPQKLS